MKHPRIPFFLLVPLALSACLEKEPRAEAIYRIECRLPTGLNIAAEDASGPLDLITDTVAPGEVAMIMHVTECSGGHVFPSNFLTRLSISTADSSGAYEVYSGVVDAHWNEAGMAHEQKVLVLVIE